MDIQSKIADAEQRFKTKEQERNGHLKVADECLTEMVKIQGEYKALLEIQGEMQEVKKVNKEKK